MTLKNLLNEALSRGENLKDELVDEVLKSKVLQEIVQSDLFAKAVSTVLKTKDEVAKVIRQNVKNVLKVMDVPSRNDIVNLSHKLDHLEKMVDRAGKKAITVKSLRNISHKKAAKKK
jgi:hypothetical protein